MELWISFAKDSSGRTIRMYSNAIAARWTPFDGASTVRSWGSPRVNSKYYLWRRPLTFFCIPVLEYTSIVSPDAISGSFVAFDINISVRLRFDCCITWASIISLGIAQTDPSETGFVNPFASSKDDVTSFPYRSLDIDIARYALSQE